MDRSATLGNKGLRSIIDHLVLPSRLPGCREEYLPLLDDGLARRLRDASRVLREHTRDEASQHWETLCSIIQTCRKLNDGGKLDDSALLAEFSRLEKRSLLILQVTEQNAGLLIHGENIDSEDFVVFESFEISSTAEAALKTPNALTWDFPGSAVALPYSEFKNEALQNSLAFFLQQASVESIKNFSARAQKAGSQTVESRDTVRPALITDMLMTLLEANGRPYSPTLLRKRVRDEVDWRSGAEFPWRRSPYWLLLRVAVQRHLYAQHGPEIGRACYKFLICVMLSHIIEDAVDCIDTERLKLLQAKLARRLTKLQVDNNKGSPELNKTTSAMFTILQPLFEKSLTLASEKIKQIWENFQNRMTPRIPTLPHDAAPKDLTLSLRNSGGYLDSILSSHKTANFDRPRPRLDILSEIFAKEGAIAQFHKFSEIYYKICTLENEAQNLYSAGLNDEDPKKCCSRLAKKINEYLDAVGNAYNDNPEQKSVMILTVMRLWTLLDHNATNAFPLLRNYSPGIPPEALDALQVLRYIDMVHLHKIQEHLHDRRGASNKRTIFEDPRHGSFAETYYNEPNVALAMTEVRSAIQSSAEKARLAKVKQWESLSQKFNETEQRIARATCIYTLDKETGGTIHDAKKCTKCYLQRCARRMQIQVFEYPLPQKEVHIRTVISELLCPAALRAYRNVTWRIIYELGYPDNAKELAPCQLLSDYDPLGTFANPRYQGEPGILLGSVTKSFTSTHYKGVRMPADYDSIFLPNGLKFKYYDTRTGAWTGKSRSRPSFAHHCQMSIPTVSPFVELQPSLHNAATTTGQTSYEVLASQGQCPSGLSMHEFTAYQTLFSGHLRRWPAILVELGASNLNFSTEATALLVSYLAVQAGPAHSTDPLRQIHNVLRDKVFCDTLIQQITRRLDLIAENWRETNSMSMLLTLILRLYAVGPESLHTTALALLDNVRQITLKWVRKLRLESVKATSSETSFAASRYAFIVSLLCKKTFLFCEDKHLDTSDLSCFIECSIALQDNMVGNLQKLSPPLRNSLIGDIKMTYSIQNCIKKSFKNSPEALSLAMNSTWPQPGDSAMGFQLKTETVITEQSWFETTFRTSPHSCEQLIQYHLLEGHILIDGLPVGKLPSQHRSAVILEKLFGKQAIVVIPSGLPGMTYMVPFSVKGHRIHIGFRNSEIVVRAYFRDDLLELIPASVFASSSELDLPMELWKDCVHWLNLTTGIIEIRRFPNIWQSKIACWKLDVRYRTAKRKRDSHSLVDPRSPVFHRIARIFKDFEPRDRLTVYQAERGINVELRRLELSFFVNKNGRLQCRQLRSEIDPNQDAGTWYGLQSKIVLREFRNRKKRSILVPFGDIAYELSGPNVMVTVQSQGDYGRFVINEIVGRLDCPPEPRLLYLKAQLHAYTSYVLPDRLTGRTGSEEAIHFLKSGTCQPWMPLTPGPSECLISISKLSPKRAFYEGIRQMQTVQWNPKLNTVSQNDELICLVRGLFEKSKTLAMFRPQKESAIQSDLNVENFEYDEKEAHLRSRSIWRRKLYERSADVEVASDAPKDLVYTARDKRVFNKAHSNVYASTTLLRRWSPNVAFLLDLNSFFRNWPTIGGFDRSFDKVLVSDSLNVDLPMEFGALTNLCRKSEQKVSYKLMFIFATMSFKEELDMALVRALIGFATIEALKELEPPLWPSYSHFHLNEVPTIDYLKQLIKPTCAPYPKDERSILGITLNRKYRRRLEDAEQQHHKKVDSDCKDMAESLLEQWPCEEPIFDSDQVNSLVDVPTALEIIKPEWLRLHQNFQLSQYIERVQRILRENIDQDPVTAPSHESICEVYPTRTRGQEIPTVYDLLSKILAHPVPKDKGESSMFSHIIERSTGDVTKVPELNELKGIVRELMNSASSVEKNYAEDLMRSVNALSEKPGDFASDKPDYSVIPLASNVFSMIVTLVSFIQLRLRVLVYSFQDDYRSKWLLKGDIWPCITPVTILKSLVSTPESQYGVGMKKAIVDYGESITWLQRLVRLEDSILRRDTHRIFEEMTNIGHENWDPYKHPLWLLLEIESNILIRKDQVNVALAIMEPSSGTNSVLQMNMGQGKTSCIMPMVVAELADTKRLARVIVPKALLLQTAQIMQSRLGGLLDRQVRHVPFSRKTPTDETTIKTYARVHREIMTASGVMISLPEHILSFMLSGLQRLSDGRHEEAELMIKIQELLGKACRDVLDESDVTLSARTQLIYPSGTQANVDGHPHRWETSEAVLKLVSNHLWNLQKEFPRSLEVFNRPQGGLPFVFFLRQDAENSLIACLVEDVLRGHIPGLPMGDRTHADRVAIKRFISEPKVHSTTRIRLKKIFGDQGSSRQTLHLLRGLFVHRILLLTLKKRYNVQYGLHPNRDPIAVPYHAKGVPSDQAEWGHPDVAILFTCLSFYFGGLQLEDLRQSLSHVLKSDDPSSGYDKWTEGSMTLPDSLREWSSINVDDEFQLREIWAHLRLDMNVIDYYLNHFVFPRHARQFDMKLQASGWDIPLFSSQTLTTGFSGTNDNKTMLPLTIRQGDLDSLSHTNAEVLTYLLQPRNRKFVVAADSYGKHISEKQLLELLTNMKVKILIDAGAQILEMDNFTLAQTWLNIYTEPQAAVYFDSDNRPYVLYRQGNRLPLSASSYADNLSQCLIYLDEAHTRGTDLRLPADAKGALTLGLGQTKDHTVQAAMRLRQLATSQSITFVAPPEVHHSILDHRKKTTLDYLDSHDVISWLLKQTGSNIEQMQPLYFAQGMDFCQRVQAASRYPNFLTKSAHREQYLRVLRQAEKQTLEQLYGPKAKDKKNDSLLLGSTTEDEVSNFVKQLRDRRKQFQDTGAAVHSSALQEVEQEREVAFEVEAVREVQKPVVFHALSFPGLHPDLLHFAQTGRLAPDFTGVQNAFASLKYTQVGRKYGMTRFASKSNLYVSREFMRTVKLPDGQFNDNLVRPINWVLWSMVTQNAVVVIPEEAELIIPLLRETSNNGVHLVTYSAPLTRAMIHFNDLSYYSIPPLPTAWRAPDWLKMELGILAGRVYFEFDEYSNICDFLEDGSDKKGTRSVSDTLEDVSMGADEDMTDEDEEQDMEPGQINEGKAAADSSKNPMLFLQEWLALRRRGQDFTHTPMGYICQGKVLDADHPFFTKRERCAANVSMSNVTKAHELSDSEDFDDGGADEFEFDDDIHLDEAM